MKKNTITEIQLQIIINNNLYKKNIIDEYIYEKVNNKLLKILNELNN